MKTLLFLLAMSLVGNTFAGELGTLEQKQAYLKKQLSKIAEAKGIKILLDSIEVKEQRLLSFVPNLADAVYDRLQDGDADYQYAYFIAKTSESYKKGKVFLFSTNLSQNLPLNEFQSDNITKEILIDEKSGNEFGIAIYANNYKEESYKDFGLYLKEIH